MYASVDSTAQTGHAGAVQEEIYQKVRSMMELYFPDLNELHQKIALRIQQHQAVASPAKQSEQFEKMKTFKYILERTIGFLQIEKSNIPPSIKEKIPMYEKQIVSLLSSNRSKKIAPSQQQGQQQFQHPSEQAQSMPQQQPSQVSQLQHHDNHVNQAKQMNLQGSVASMQSAPVPNIQHRSVSTHVTVPASQQNMANALQPLSTLDPGQGNSFSSLQQGALAPMQQGGAGSLQNTINAPQQSNRKKVMNPKEPTFTCPVCLNELVESCSTICGHIFCQGCIKMTVQKLKKCPTCTRALTMKNFHRVYLPTIEFNIDSP